MSTNDAGPVVQTKSSQSEASKVVTKDDGATFARKFYKKGETISCTNAQAKVLAAHGIIGEVK